MEEKQSLHGGMGERTVYSCALSLTKNESSKNSNSNSCIIVKSPFSLQHVSTPLTHEIPVKREPRRIDGGGDRN